MSTIQRFRNMVLGIVALLTLALVAPIAVHAEEQVLGDEQVLSVDEQVPALASAAAASWGETSGYNAVEAARALAAQHALQTGDIGSMQEEWLYAIVAAPSWDETSGYGSLEAGRAETVEYEAPAAGASDEAALRAQFRAVEVSLSHSLGAEQLEILSCAVGD
jgi:hypothetical protein